MASRFRSLYDPEAQDAMDQVPVAPERPQIDIARAQTLARSTSNPDAQRLGNAMLVADERQQAQDARQAATDQRKADVEARRQQSEQERQAKAEQARSVRAAAAAGAETVTDIETGRRTVATHPDGAVKYETGPVGQPVIQPTAEAAASSIPGMGGFMSLTRPADQQTLGQTQEVAQTYRDDRGGQVVAPLPTKTDAKTGAISSTVKDPVTGRPSEVSLGTDPSVQADLAKKAEFEQRRNAIALKENRVKQERLRFEPQWKPVNDEFVAAGKELNAFTDPEKVKFIRDPKTGKMAKRDPNTGLPSREYVDPNELVKWQKDQADIQARHDRAKAAHDKLEPFARNLNRNETELKDAKLKLVEEKIRHDSGLPDEDGGASTILATASGEVEKPAGQQAVDEHVFPMVYAPEVLDAAQAQQGEIQGPPVSAKPLVPTDSPDKAKVFADAFGGLVAADKLTLGASGDGFQFIQRDGANIGSVDKDKHGTTFVTMGENLNGTEDLRQSVAFGTTTGVPVYLHDTAGVPRDTVKEAQYVASIFDALKDPILAQDKAMGAARLNMLDATPAAIARKVSTGELSIQHGEAIMKEVYNSTLKADDPLSPETFGKWISGADQEVKDKYTAAAKAKDTAALNAIKNDYASEWYVANRGKPGVNFKTREIAAAALTGKLRTGEKASALGGGLVEAGGSMVGMLSAPGMLGYLAVNELANGSDADSRKAMDDTLSNYGRASKNTWRGWELSREKWFTGEGKAKLSAFEDAQRALGATIRAQDGYRGGIEDPEWKQEYKARVDAVTDAAYAMHAMNLEEGWEVTRDDLDPSKNPGLAKLVNGYAITGDRSLLDGYFKALMEDHGTRQAQGYLADLTMGRGKFMSALISGANAPPEEIGVEIASTILTAGIGKAVFGGAKTAKLMEAGAEAATSASRMTRFRLGALGIKNEFMEAGMVADTLATPASKLGKASNFIVKGAKVSGANAVSEGLEEAAMSPADRNANADSIIKDAAMGALAGFFMGPVMAGPSVLAQSSRQAYDQNQAAKTFADSYNTANRGAEGFTPVTVEQAKTAMALAPDDVRVKLTEASKAATTNLIAAVEAAKNSTDPVVLNALSRAQAVSLITHDALATDAAMRTEAVIAIQNTDPANKDFAMALAKVASGRTDLLTGVERSAVAGKQTQGGKPYFATVQKFTPEGEAVTVDVVTDAGRAEAMQNFPQVAALIQTTESQAIFDAAQQATTPPPATNEQDPQGQQSPPPQDPQPAPADENAPVPGGGNGTPAPVSGGTGAAAPQASVSGNAAAMDAAEYTALRSQDPTLPDIPAVVAAARAAGQPVSPSMEKEAGTPQPGGQPVSGSGQTVSDPALDEASGVASAVVAKVEAAMPSLKGRFVIADGEHGGGAEMQIETGKIILNLPAIKKAIKRAGGDIAKATAILETIVARHEVVHVVQTQALRPMWETAGKPGTFEGFFLDYYATLAPDLLTKQASAAARQIYGKEQWDRIPSNALKAAEFVRMLVEAKLDPKKTGEFSELFRSIENRGAKAKITALIKAAVEMLRKMKLTGAAAEHVAKVEELYRELTEEAEKAPSVEPAPAPSNEGVKPPPPASPTVDQANPERFILLAKDSGQSEIRLNGEVIWRGPDADAQAELESLQAAQSSPMRITGDAIKAALVKFPRLSGKLRGELEAAADEIMDELDAVPAGERMAAAEKAIADRIDRIADREAERTGKNRMEVIEGFRAVAGKRASQQAASIEQAVIGSDAPQVPEGKQESRPTPNGEMTVDVVSTYLDLSQLVGSSDPLFPGGALQPRNRSTQASQNQREEMVQNLRDKPDQSRRYIEGVTTDAGRMIVAPLFAADGTHMTNEAGKPLFYVLSGNGRRNALKEAANRNVSGPVMKGFREASVAEGIDTESMTLPVPVAVFVPKSAKEAIDLAEYSNRDAQLSVSNTEQANRDASSIEKANILKLWEPDASGDPAAASNRDFVKAFARAVGDEGILDTRGELTDEGAKRIERAMVAMLLGPDQGPVLDSLFNRSGALGLRAILGGVASETGSLLKLAGAKPDFDLSPVLANALKTAVEAKQAVANGQFRDVSEFFDQGSLFESTENTPERQLARAIVESRSRKAVREILAAYRKGADAVDTSTMSMFAEEETTRESLILKALEARPVEQVVAEIEAEFGKSSDLAGKLRVGVPAIKKLDAGQRREFMAGVNAEVDRLRSGVMSAEEWQRLNPDALGAKEALFQRFLDSHTAETIAGGFNRLLSPKVQGVLGSSEEPSAPREHLGIPRKNMPQIPITRRGRFARWMLSQGIGLTVRETSANEVGPTQSDMSDAALKGSRKHTRTRNVLVSSDGYILDGHHQWAVAKEAGRKFTAVWFDLPVRKALAKMKQFERVDYDNMVGTDYENEEYQYLGEAAKSWRDSDHPEAAIVNPINENLSPDEKVDALLELGMENVSLVERILSDLKQSMGLEGKYSLKLPERIQAKASRPSIRDEKPWHDIEHVRDGLRFKVSMQNFDQLPAIAETLRRNGVEIVKFDTAKMFKPKEWGWRFVAFDLRMPNGQLVEFYAPVPELDNKSVKGPNHHLFEDWRNVSVETWQKDSAIGARRASAIKQSWDRYTAAFMVAIRRMGYATLEEAEAAWTKAVTSAASSISDQSERGLVSTPDVQMAGSVASQAPEGLSNRRRMNALLPGSKTSLDPESETNADPGQDDFEVADIEDSDGAFTPSNTKSTGYNQGNSGSSLGSSADQGFDLFGSIEPAIMGPRAKVKRNMVAAAMAQPANGKGRANIAKDIAKREGLADLDLFAASAVKSLDKKPKRAQGDGNDLDLFSGTRGTGDRQSDGNPASQPGQSGTVRGMAGEQGGDLFSPGVIPAGFSGSERSGGSRGGRGATSDGPAGDSGRGATGESDSTGTRGDRRGRNGGTAGPDAGLIDLGETSIPDVIATPANEADRNARINPGETLVPKGQGAKIAANFKVIDLLRQLTTEARNPTELEKAQLLTYSGWGHSKGAFDDSKAKAFETRREDWLDRMWQNDKARFKREQNYRQPLPGGKEKASTYDLYAWNEKWGETHRELHERLSDKEYNAAKRSVLNAHYTTPAIIDAQWQMVEKLGFKGGRALEPGGGIGHYIGTQPQHLAERTIWSAVELDQVTAQILALLYPQARVNSVSPAPGREVVGQGFEEALIADNSQDIVISNVPFHETGPWQSEKQFKQKLNLHNYFFARALQKVKPGGFVVFITSSSTMENNSDQRRFLASRGELISAVRLPNNAFEENAGTQVTTDIIILRKPDGRKVESHSWLGTRVVGRDTVNLKRGDQTPIQYLKSFDLQGTWQDETLEAARKAWDDLRQAGLKIPDGKEFKAEQKANATATAEAWKSYVKAFEAAESNSIGLRLGAELPIRVNEYFAANPQNAFGRHSLAGSMYRSDEYALQEDLAGGTLEQRFAKVIEALPSDIMGQASTVKLGTVQDIERSDKPFSFVERDGKFWQVQKNHLEPVEWSNGEIVVFRSWNRVKNAIRDLIAAELDPTADPAEVVELRDTLNKDYGKHVGQFGPISKTGVGQKHGHLSEDPDFPLTVALEEPVKYTDRKGKSATRYDKADIFRVRMNKPLAPPVKAESVSDALLASLVWMGYPHAGYMAKLLGRPEAAVRQEMIESELVFDDPTSGNLVIRDSYLSGFVQGKLDEAKAAAVEDPAYRRNVAALEAALPERKGIAQIGVSMNSPWLPPEVMTAFMESLGLSEAGATYSVAANSWTVAGFGNSDELSTADVPTVELIQHALAMTVPRVSNYEGRGADRKLVFDPAATQIAKSKLDKLKMEFQRWAKTSDAEVNGTSVQEIIVQAFNEKANGIKPPSFKGEHITLPGASDEVFRSGIRRAAIARMIDQGSGMIAHGVGFGKTYTLIALAMELKRLGKANRPMIIVENATLTQFAASFRTAYPNARVLVADEKSFAGPKRRQFIARIATGDHDAILMAHSQFNLIGNHPDVVNSYINEQVKELEDARALTDSSDARAVAALEKAKIGLENSRKKILDALASRQDIGMTWEDLGIDTLLVDEAHRYKNAPVITRMQGMKNLPTGAPSQRAIGMVIKTKGIQDKMAGRGVFFATGTPVSNSMAEAYVMLRYTSPHLLKQSGIENFDQFVASFGVSETKAEANWKGAISMETRLSKFINGNALINLIRSSWDVQMDPDVAGIKRPTIKGGAAEQVMVKPGPANQAYNDWVVNTIAPQWEDPGFWDSMGGKRQAFEDNPWMSAVPIMTMQAGIAAALDIRLIDPNAADFEDSKVNTAVRKIVENYKATQSYLGTQAVFADLRESFSVDHLLNFAGDPGLSEQGMEIPEVAPVAVDADGNPLEEQPAPKKVKKVKAFDLYQDIAAKLVKANIPRGEIGLISSSMSPEKRSEMFDKVNSGEIRVIVGSTDLMGVGVNMQERLYALHHLMPPRDFKPASQEQRTGRILRQGNLHYDMALEAFVASAEASTGKTFRKDKGGRMVPDMVAAAAALEGNEAALTTAEAAAEVFHIQELQYAMEKSIDSAIFSMMASKQRMVVQLLMGEVTDSFEDPSDAISMGMAEIAARAIGDPTLIRRVELEREIRNLNMEFQGFQNDLMSAKASLRDTESKLARNGENLEQAQRFADSVGKIGTDTERETVWEFGGQTVDRNKPKDAEKGWKAPKLIEALDLYLAEESRALNNSDRKKADVQLVVDGVKFNIEIHQSLGDTRTEKEKYDDQMAGKNSSRSAVGVVYWNEGKNRSSAAFSDFSGAQSLIASINSMAKQARNAPALVEQDAAYLKRILPGFQFKASQTFDRSDELAALYTEMDEVEARLANNANPQARTPKVKTSPKSETPANYPGKGLAPAMQTLGSSEELPQTAANIIALAKELDPAGVKAMLEDLRAFFKRSEDEGIDWGPQIKADKITLGAQGVLVKFANKDPRAMAMLDGYGEDQFSRLRSSADESAAVQEALAKMPPIYRKVFEDIEAGDSPAVVMKRHDISERAVTNILNQVHARIAVATAAAGDTLKPAMRDGLIDGGRPDLALSTNPTIAAVDQARNESEVPDVRGWDEVNAKAADMLAKDYQGTYDMLLGKARDLQPMTDQEVAAAKMIIARETISGKITTAADRVKLGMMIYGYREIGTETARSLAIRRDPHLRPAERHAQFIAEALFTPDAETRRRMKNNPKAAETILAGWMQRVDAIEAELLAQGIDIRAALAEFNANQESLKQTEAESPRAAKVIEEQIRKLGRREKAVIEAIRSGALVSKAAFLTGLSTDEVKAIYSRFLTDIRSAMAESAKRFLAGSLGSSSGDMMSEILGELGLPDLSLIDDTQADFVDRRNEKPRAPRKPRKPKAPEVEAPEVPGLTPEQQAAIDEAFERFKNADPSTWKTFWQTEAQNLTPLVGQVGFDAFKGEAQSAWTAEQADLFKLERERGEVSTTTGTFDIHDPVAVKAVMDAFAVARGGKMDALMEFWKMSILTGPQTHIVNVGSNALNSAFNLLPRRGVEALVNNLLGIVGQGSDRAATFAEFAPMAKNLRKGVQLAARMALRSWQAETRTFEAYARAEALQLDFSGVGAEYIPPALGGKIGKVMRSLSFRAMTAADEFQKSLYAQMEAAAQSHRIAAVEEKLTGPAYAKRIDELMRPGSKAWIRAIDEAKRITFQDDIDGTNPQAIRRIDQLAELAKKGRNMPWIGRPLTFFLPFIDTPTNIFKMAVEMSPLGGFLAVVDMSRALKRRVMSGTLTKAEAQAEAELIYDRARLVRDLTNQTIAWAVFFAMQGLVGGDDEEDELPVITGTVPYKTTRRGERDNAFAVMPPQTIRLGDVQVSYARIEPFATLMASTVDLLVSMNRHGGFQPAVASEWFMRFKDQAKDKTFLQGVSNLLNAVEDPDRFAERLTANIVSGFVPNIIRQPVREADSVIRDQNPAADDGFFTAVAKRVGFTLVPQMAPAKMDVWGNEVKTNRGDQVGGTALTDAAFRIFDPTNARVNPDIDPIDRWIFRYNLQTADSKDRVVIEPISNSVSGRVPGEKRPRVFALTAAEQAEANRAAGQAARSALGEDWKNQPLNRETAEQIMETVRKAQSVERERLRAEKLSEIP